ncbi:DUF4377 domain-containing protein [Aquimarina latercula]|uniref:DUF4377 domain-containing protein n=1 Tax=Aquimarina latercula TaxID=987 RepID=UPI00040F87D3|nr:DUF4377 domain-containing protein [Aquimarina latercula]
MKKKFLLLVIILTISISCNNDDEIIEITNIRVNHYQDTGLVTFWGDLGVIILTQEGDQIGEEEFTNSHEKIQGFEYELGFIHDLQVSKTHIPDPPQDGSSIRIDLIRVLSKTAVSSNTEFKVRLTMNTTDGTFYNWTTVDQENNHALINSSISIDCQDLCLELSNKINNQEQLTGVFTHGSDNQYVLKEIIDE